MKKTSTSCAAGLFVDPAQDRLLVLQDRLYYTQRGSEIVVLLCGGDKDSQDRDIREARRLAKEL